MMTRSILPAALSLCLLASPMAAEELTDMTAGAKVSNFVTIGETQIPLPKGEWELKLVDTKRNQSFGKLGIGLLIQETNESGFQAVEMISNVDRCAPNGWNKHICGRKDTHHNESSGAPNQKNAECWNVNHFSINPNRKYTKGFWEKYKNDKMDLFKTISEKRITLLDNQFRFSDQCHFVNLHYFVNPEKFDFPSESSKWTDSAWHRNIVGKDPRRAEFVAAVTNAGRELKDAVKSGFNGKLDGWTSDIALKFE